MKQKQLYIILSVMFIFIIGGFLLLDQKEAATGEDQPTAYIEGNESKISFKLAGRIEQLLVEEGMSVKKGQVLGYLQNEELQAKVAQAEAAVQVAQGQITQAQGAQQTAEAKKQQGTAATTVTESTSDKKIKQAAAAVKAAQAQLQALQNGARPEELQQAKSQMEAAEKFKTLAQNNAKRLTSLLQDGLVSQVEVDKANADYAEANAKYEIAKQQYELAKKGPRSEEITAAKAQLEQAQAAYELAVAAKGEVAIRQGDVSAAEAGIAQATGAVTSAQSGKSQAEAALAEAKTYLSYTQLIAPADGIIKTRAAAVGELVNAGFPVFTLEETSARWSKFYFSEKDVATMEVGDTVQIQVIATGDKLKAKIVAIAPAADFAIQKATQDIDDTDLRSFSVKVKYITSPKAKTGMTVKWLTLEGENRDK